MTAHRSENVDDPQILQNILDGAGQVSKKQKVEVIYPMHPRTRSKMSSRRVPKGIRIMNPLGFYDYNNLTLNALCLLSDSGTTPEEGLFYKVPCVSLRKTSERYETVEGGAHIIGGVEKNQIVEAVQMAIKLPFNGRYDFCEDYSPGNVVVNVLQSHIKHYFE
jgi:UDP-N-acetylglucosamine 2-epimerase (non-hydrolysing)